MKIGITNPEIYLTVRDTAGIELSVYMDKSLGLSPEAVCWFDPVRFHRLRQLIDEVDDRTSVDIASTGDAS